MTQTSINFDALARTSDPVTSSLSAAETAPRLNRLHRCVLEAAALIEGDFTSREVAEAAARLFPGAEVESYRKRAASLVQAGAICENSIRCCRVTGKPARAFILSVDKSAFVDKITGHGRGQRPVPNHQQPLKEVADV